MLLGCVKVLVVNIGTADVAEDRINLSGTMSKLMRIVRAIWVTAFMHLLEDGKKEK